MFYKCLNGFLPKGDATTLVGAARSLANSCFFFFGFTCPAVTYLSYCNDDNLLVLIKGITGRVNRQAHASMLLVLCVQSCS